MTTLVSSTTRCACAWCKAEIPRGGVKVILDRQKFEKPMRKLATFVAIRQGHLSIGVSLRIASFLFSICSDVVHLESYCPSCCNQCVYITKSGRISKKPLNSIISTVTGSGCSGCDHYDHSYDGSFGFEPWQTGFRGGADLKDFIVSDDDIIVHFDSTLNACGSSGESLELEYSSSESDEDSEIEQYLFSSDEED
jgi:hypothetical protein